MKNSRFLWLIAGLFMMVGCHERNTGVRPDISLDDFKEWNVPEYSLYSHRIRRTIDSLGREGIQMYADGYARKYYTSGSSFLWITRSGVDRQADTLLSYLDRTPGYGLSSKSFHTEELRKDLQRIRTLDFDAENDINTVFGRTEYRLTQAFLRYACGQRFGYVRPNSVLNRLEQTDTAKDSPFRKLYDIPTETADETFVQEALQAKRNRTLATFLDRIQPNSPTYAQLTEAYRNATAPDMKDKIAVNIERSRWRTECPTGKYVWVNLAGMYLIAADEKEDEHLEMKVCGGSTKHKSPLLTSKIERIDLNPYWVVPYSIIKKEIAPNHARSETYFSRNRIRIFDKESGEEMDPKTVSASMLTSGRYRLRQDNGEGNSLGRIIFRFANDFSVFLHDTDNKKAFSRDNRAISHGCIRVEKPLELAIFLMDHPDETAIDKLRMEIGLPPLCEEKAQKEEEEEEKTPKVGVRRLTTPIPIFLNYYTVYPNSNGGVDNYPDIYQYDEALLKKLKAF